MQWIQRIADSDLSTPGAQPEMLYVALCVLVPAVMGVLIALLFIGAETVWRRLT